ELERSCVADEPPLPFQLIRGDGDPGLPTDSSPTDSSPPLTGDVREPDPLVLSPTTGPIEMDGMLNEVAWAGADRLPLVTMRPTAGLSPAAATDVRVTYDEQYLYVGGRLESPHPSGPVVHTYVRDEWADDDILEVLLDTWNDNETGVVFSVNPAGVRIDAQVTNDAEFTWGFPVNESWNAHWDAETSRGPRGWTVEMRIPFSSLRFQPVGGRVVMGMLVHRFLARHNESSTFPAVEPSWNLGMNKPSLARDVVLEGVRPARPVHVSPYLSGGVERDWGTEVDGGHPVDDRSRIDVGGDVRFAPSENLNVDLTVNPDFAQVEADDEQVNLTRFDLFLPEKRQFFQERAGLFDFRTGRGDRLFHSRRIGIVNGEQVRILGGARLTGRMGEWDVGSLLMRTDAGAPASGETFGATRVRRRVLNDLSYLGAMLTSRTGPGNSDLALGVDGSLRLPDGRIVSARWALNLRNGEGGWSSSSAQLLLENRGTRGLGYQLGLSRTGRAYDPAMGFVRRGDYRELSGRLTWGFLPPESSAVHRWGPRIEASWLVRDSDGVFETGEVSAGWELELKDGTIVNGGVVATREDLVESFGLAEGVDVPAGRHQFVWTRVFARTPPSSPLSASLFGRAGQFFDGTIVSATLSPRWRASPRLELSTDLEHSRLRFGSRRESFDAAVVRLRARIALDRHLSTETFIQYNSAAGALVGNLRARYNFAEGRDLWLVLNEVRNVERHGPDRILPDVDDRTLLVKYVHTFRAF
ncbi:MAG: DUF5916 domain-containing protein, partial [Gemmatimonadota bacterium]